MAQRKPRQDPEEGLNFHTLAEDAGLYKGLSYVFVDEENPRTDKLDHKSLYERYHGPDVIA